MQFRNGAGSPLARSVLTLMSNRRRFRMRFKSMGWLQYSCQLCLSREYPYILYLKQLTGGMRRCRRIFPQTDKCSFRDRWPEQTIPPPEADYVPENCFVPLKNQCVPCRRKMNCAGGPAAPSQHRYPQRFSVPQYTAIPARTRRDSRRERRDARVRENL